MYLCYAEDPDIVIKEACRVLKSGGCAGFTIWGRSKDSPAMTIVPDVLDELGLVPKDSNERSRSQGG
jgi:SAM-dependent methyltransferase